MINKSNVDKEADIWSLGILLFTLVHGHTPYAQMTTQQKMSAIKNGRKLTFGKLISPELVDLIAKMVVYYPRGRMTINNIFLHPWMQQWGFEYNIDMEKFREKSIRLPLKRYLKQKAIKLFAKLKTRESGQEYSTKSSDLNETMQDKPFSQTQTKRSITPGKHTKFLEDISDTDEKEQQCNQKQQKIDTKSSLTKQSPRKTKTSLEECKSVNNKKERMNSLRKQNIAQKAQPTSFWGKVAGLLGCGTTRDTLY